ncbi:MAG: ascorbate transporter subunit [Firmicutes bacterium]|nr:ascorbate transporter subunit [Bacillota bacterium]HWR29560.1 PTS transporter subunit IIC [Negativicutes bacterium]
MKEILDFIIFQLLDKATVFLGIVAFIGLWVQKKSWSEIVDGVIKTVIGLLIIVIGAGTLLGSLGPVINILNSSLGVKGVVPANEAAFSVAMATPMANNITMTFLLGFGIHLLMVFLLPWKIFKNVYLTAHMMLFLSTFLNLSLPVVIGLSGTPLIVVSAFLCALYWTLTPGITRVIGREFLGDDLTLGHHQQAGAYLASRVGKYFGDKSQDAEDLELPPSLAIFRDNTISMTILMALIFLGIGIAVGQPAIAKLSGKNNWIIWLVLNGFQFTAGIVVLLSGVRMFIGSIVPAFKGISNKIIPGAVPALDSPAIYPYSPVGAMIGFVSSVVAALVVMVLLIVVKSPIIVFPSPIIMFFDGCAIGVFGNKYGGWKGAMYAGFISSFLAHIGCVFLYPLMGPVYGSGLMFSNIDFTLIWLPFLYLLKLIAPMLGLV